MLVAHSSLPMSGYTFLPGPDTRTAELVRQAAPGLSMEEYDDVVVFILVSGAPARPGARPRLRDRQTHLANQVQGRPWFCANLCRCSPASDEIDYLWSGHGDTIRYRLAAHRLPAYAATSRETRSGRGDLGNRPGHRQCDRTEIRTAGPRSRRAFVTGIPADSAAVPVAGGNGDRADLCHRHNVGVALAPLPANQPPATGRLQTVT